MSTLRTVAPTLASRWNALWFAPASPYPIAAFRILLGLFLVVFFGSMAPDVATLFSNEGVYAPYLVPDYAPSPAVAWLLFAWLWLCCLALMLGYRCNLIIGALLLLYFHHYFLGLAVKHSSFERLIVIYLLALWPSGCDRVWALCASRHREHDSPASSFASRLVRFQTVVLYLGAGLWKVANPAWQSGVLLKATLQGVWATPLAFAIVRHVPSERAFMLLSHSLIAAEILLGVTFFFVRTRPFAIVLGLLFHIGNCVILNIPEFLVCLAPYVFFVDETRFERWAARIERFRTRSRAAS